MSDGGEDVVCVIDRKGLGLGMASVKFWSRKKFKDTLALKRRVNPTRVLIGPPRGEEIREESGLA